MAPNAVTGEKLEGLREEAKYQFAESSSDLQANGDTIVLLGKEAVDGKSCYKIRFTALSGRVRYVYYDTESFLVVRNDEVVPFKNEEEKLLTVAISDYRSVNGVLFPHTFKADSVLTSAFAWAERLPLPMTFFERKKDFTTSMIQTIEINPDMDESSFQVPGTSTVEPAKR